MKLDIKDNKIRYEGKEFGWCYREVDGFYVFIPFAKGGYYPSYLLRAVADYLDELNEPLNKQLEIDLKEKNDK